MKFAIGGLTRFAKNPDSFKTKEYEPKEKGMILAYMKSFDPVAVGAGDIDDCKTGESIPITYLGYSDDEYSWSNQDIYHVEKYNAAVNQEFIDHIRSIQY